MNPLLALIPGRVWIGGAVTVVLLAGGGYALHRYGEGRFMAGQSETQARWDEVLIAEQAAAVQQAGQNARETQRRLDRQKENDDAQAAQLARAARDLADAHTAGQRLHQQSEALRAAIRGAASDPAAGPSSAPAGDALDLFADLFSRADGRAGELAEALDRSYAAGLRCQWDYDALTDAKP